MSVFYFVEGYFHAKVDGDYLFALMGDDLTRMKLSTVQNSANKANLVTILDQTLWSGNHYFSTVVNQTTSATVTLDEGLYYF